MMRGPAGSRISYSTDESACTNEPAGEDRYDIPLYIVDLEVWAPVVMVSFLESTCDLVLCA